MHALFKSKDRATNEAIIKKISAVLKKVMPETADEVIEHDLLHVEKEIHHRGVYFGKLICDLSLGIEQVEEMAYSCAGLFTDLADRPYPPKDGHEASSCDSSEDSEESTVSHECTSKLEEEIRSLARQKFDYDIQSDDDVELTLVAGYGIPAQQY